MTKTHADYYCKKCNITFEAPFNPDVIRPRRACPKCQKVVDIKKNTNSTQKTPPLKKQGNGGSDPQTQPLTKEELINKLDNPIEFVQSIIVEELMNTRDVRWAQLFTTILDKTKKLDYDTIKEKEWLNQAKNMSLDEIVKNVAIKGSISRSTLRRLDELDDTSPLDNFSDA